MAEIYVPGMLTDELRSLELSRRPDDSHLRALRTPEMDEFFDEILVLSERTIGDIHGHILDRLNMGKYDGKVFDEADPAHNLLLDLQRREDAWLRRFFPSEHAKVEAYYGTFEERLEIARHLRDEAMQVISSSSDPDDGLVVLRWGIKNNTRILEKSSRYGIPMGQIFDICRIQAVTSDHFEEKHPFNRQRDQAQRLSVALASYPNFSEIVQHVLFDRINPRGESRVNVTDIHDSRRSTLEGDGFNDFYRSRYNCWFEEWPCEIQVVPAKEFRKLNEQGRISHK